MINTPHEPTHINKTSHLAELLTRASWRVRRSGKAELAARGITFAQARALRYIVRSDTPLRMSDLATQLEVVPRSATTSVDILEEACFVERKPDPEDRRSILLVPTKSDKTLIDKIDEERRKSADKLFSILSEEEQKTLYALLEKMCAQDPSSDHAKNVTAAHTELHSGKDER